MTAPRPKPPPSMPLFGDAYLADTQHLTLEEHGAYLKLLIIAWRTDECGLPDDDRRLAMMLGVGAKKWAKLRPMIAPFWTITDGLWRQKKQTEVRKWVDAKRETNKRAAKARWEWQHVEDKRDDRSERISKGTGVRIASQTQDSSVSYDTAPNGAVVDPKKALFDLGVSYLGTAGIGSQQARSLIGKWRKAHGDGATTAALMDARNKAISEPVAWISKTLSCRQPNGGNPSYSDWYARDRGLT